MKIIINGKSCDFISGFNPHKPSNNGWQKQNQDAFKFITVQGINVFVKRFEKDKNLIPGYQFIIRSKNKKLPNIPTIYDFVTTTENSKTVCYLFQEALEGSTLEEIINKGIFDFNPYKFTRHLYNALESINNNGFWFSDFVEKNIFIAKNGDYYLIDIDSVVPLSVLPCEGSPILSGVNNNYKIAVFNYFYKETFKYPFAYIKRNLRGNTINFLELFVLVSQIKYALEYNLNPNFFDVKTRKAIPSYLLKKNPTFTNAVFKNCFEMTSNQQQVLPLHLFESYIKTVLGFNDSLIRINFSKKKVISGYTNLIKTPSPPTVFIDSDKVNKLLVAINNCIDINQIAAAKKNLNKLIEIDPNNIKINSLNKIIFKIEQEKRDIIKKFDDECKRLKRKGLIPYKCPNCKFPVKQKEKKGLSNLMYVFSACLPVFALFHTIGFWSFLGLILGPFFWRNISNVLPDSWTKEPLTCINCKKQYYFASSKY
jgi:hypothetical protein